MRGGPSLSAHTPEEEFEVGGRGREGGGEGRRERGNGEGGEGMDICNRPPPNQLLFTDSELPLF